MPAVDHSFDRAQHHRIGLLVPMADHRYCDGAQHTGAFHFGPHFGPHFRPGLEAGAAEGGAAAAAAAPVEKEAPYPSLDLWLPWIRAHVVL